jgi:hypothetical protein
MADTTSSQEQAPWWAWWSAAVPGRTPWLGVAPQSLDQPINPGWSFGNVITVNSVNSTAPDVERAVVSQHSYGRQIGRLMDAVAALADALPQTATDNRVKVFRELEAKVEAIKKAMAPERVERLRRELQELQRTDQTGWDSLKAMFK